MRPSRRPIASLENDHCLQWLATGFTEPPNLEIRWPAAPKIPEARPPAVLLPRRFPLSDRGSFFISSAKEGRGPENGSGQLAALFLDDDRRAVIALGQGFGERQAHAGPAQRIPHPPHPPRSRDMGIAQGLPGVLAALDQN